MIMQVKQCAYLYIVYVYIDEIYPHTLPAMCLLILRPHRDNLYMLDLIYFTNKSNYRLKQIPPL